VTGSFIKHWEKCVCNSVHKNLLRFRNSKGLWWSISLNWCMKTTVFWDIMMCSLVEVHQCFRGILVIFYQITRLYIPKEITFKSHCFENLKSQILTNILDIFYCFNFCQKIKHCGSWFDVNWMIFYGLEKGHICRYKEAMKNQWEWCKHNGNI
jgi:hypothetical protein